MRSVADGMLITHENEVIGEYVCKRSIVCRDVEAVGPNSEDTAIPEEERLQDEGNGCGNAGSPGTEELSHEYPARGMSGRDVRKGDIEALPLFGLLGEKVYKLVT